MMFKNIIWATDGSEHADRALEYATRMARSDGGRAALRARQRLLHLAHCPVLAVPPDSTTSAAAEPTETLTTAG